MRRNLTSLFILVYLVAHLAVAMRGIEDFPFTSAVMFARDIGSDRPLYSLHWRVLDSEGFRSDASPRRIGLNPRHFFLHVYLPDLADSPYHGRQRADDDPDAYEARMTGWFEVLATRWRRSTGREPVRIDFEVHPYGATVGAEHTLGQYDVAARRFRRTLDAPRTER